MKKMIVTLVCCFLLSTTLVLALFLMSDSVVGQHNSFYRKIPPHALKVNRHVLDIKFNSYYIAGGTGSHTYLGNSTAPLHILQASASLADTQHITIDLKKDKKLKYRYIQAMIDSPYFYLTDGVAPFIFSGKINEWTARRVPYDSAYFTAIAPITNSSFIIRSMEGKSQQYMLGKEKAQHPNVQLQPNLLKKQIDGLIDVDGMLHYDKTLNRVVYLYYFRNEYLILDTALNLLAQGHTIDTISRVKIKTSRISSENAITMSAPPLVVNNQSAVSGNLLFVRSNIIAKNESPEAFEGASVIDVYNLDNQSYQFSFYLFDYGSKLRTFDVYEDRLVALYDQYLLSYDFEPQYISKAKADRW